MNLPYDTLDQDTCAELSALITLLLLTEQADALQPDYKVHLNNVRDELNTTLVSRLDIPDLTEES